MGTISFKKAKAWVGSENEMIPATSIAQLLSSGNGKSSVTRAVGQSNDSLKIMMQVSDAIEPAKAIGKDSPNKRGVKSPQSPAKEKEGKVPK